MLKYGFKRFLSGDNGSLNFAAHSHHFWPDVSFKAQQESWEIAAKYADQKWEKDVFPNLLPDVSKHIARQLNLPDADSLAFAPNTHEFVVRLLSCFKTPIRVLTTDSEFHSFSRQITRMEEAGDAVVTRIPTEPFETFSERLATVANRGKYDLVFFSHVFFNSGFAIPDLTKLVQSIDNKDNFIVVDGYHGFMAVPTDLSAIADRAFYIAGGYKYAMSGEGCCFMHCPPNYGLKPVNTGWLAAFGALGDTQTGEVPYSTDGFRFMGATFDPTALYRFRAVQNWLKDENVTVEDIHKHVHGLHEAFINNLTSLDVDTLIVPIDNKNRGHFLTFRTDSASDLHQKLMSLGVMTDYRGDRLRFGFSVYHDLEDVKGLHEKLQNI